LDSGLEQNKPNNAILMDCVFGGGSSASETDVAFLKEFLTRIWALVADFEARRIYRIPDSNQKGFSSDSSY
jgi:hypothetical protein